MSAFFFTTVGVVIAQRLIELGIARRNGKKIKQMGGYEAGADHYKYLVALHTMFFACLIGEVWWRNPPLPPWWVVPFGMFMCAQALRIWCIVSLGVFWNTRIYVMPDMHPVAKGPYRFFRHPNYAAVIAELCTLPLTFDAVITATLIPLFNAMILKKRIAVEEAALAGVSGASALYASDRDLHNGKRGR